MTANRQSGMSVSMVLEHLQVSYTEVNDSATENFAPDFLSSQLRILHPCYRHGYRSESHCRHYQLSWDSRGWRLAAAGPRSECRENVARVIEMG